MQCEPLLETQCPTLVLVIHQRLEVDDGVPINLPYGEATFKKACKKLFQHRSITNTLHQKSTVVFNSRLIHWGSDTPGKSRGTYQRGCSGPLTPHAHLVTDFMLDMPQYTIASRIPCLLVLMMMLYCQQPHSALDNLFMGYFTAVLQIYWTRLQHG